MTANSLRNVGLTGTQHNPFWTAASAASGDDLTVSSTTPDWVIEAGRKLGALSELPRGWDSYGGAPLRPEIKHFALRLLGRLEMDVLPVPNLVLGSGGTVQFEWRRGGRELDIEILHDERVEFVRMDADEIVEEGVGRVDPDSLRRLTAWLLHG